MHCCVIGLCGESEKSHDYFLNLEKLGDTYRRIYNEKKTTRTQEENTLLDKA